MFKDLRMNEMKNSLFTCKVKWICQQNKVYFRESSGQFLLFNAISDYNPSSVIASKYIILKSNTLKKETF